MVFTIKERVKNTGENLYTCKSLEETIEQTEKCFGIWRTPDNYKELIKSWK